MAEDTDKIVIHIKSIDLEDKLSSIENMQLIIILFLTFHIFTLVLTY